MNTKLHPLELIRNMLHGKDALIQFSEYKYEKDTATDIRNILQIHASELTEKWVDERIENLPEGYELALNSKISKKNKHFHIPMIDFSTSNWDSQEIIERFRKFIPSKITKNMHVYDSGRSFHGYSEILISNTEWLNFMGRLLLTNPINSKEVIDSRWIGHRIMGGYSSLRWSNNTSLYVSIPTKIKFP